MRVETDTPDRLIVVSRTWFLTIATAILGVAPVLGAIFDPDIGNIWVRIFLLTFGLTILWLALWKMPFLTLIFDRPSDTITVTQHRITGNTRRTIPLASVTGAMHQSDWSDNARLERLALKTPDGPLPLEFGYFSTPRQPVADAINAWLESAAPSA